MSFSISHSKKEKITAVIDIGSSSVGGAFVSLREGETPEVLYSVRQQMVIQDKLDFGRFLSSMLHTLDGVLSEMEKTAQSKKIIPRKFFCFLSSLWYESETKVIKTSKDRSFIVNEKLLTQLVDNEVSLFRSNIIKKKKTGEINLVVIDTRTIQIKINGYETNSPYGKSAKDIELALFVSMSDERVLKLIEVKISHLFNQSDIEFISFPLAAFSIIRDIFTDKNNFLFLDITGETTDVSMVKNNILVKTKSFPKGKNFLIRRIANGLNTNKEEAISLFRMYIDKKINKTTGDKLTIVLSDTKRDWLASFTDTLLSLSKEFSIPHTIFFTADNNAAEVFYDSIENNEFEQFILIGNKFNVSFLSEKILEKFILFNKDTQKDSFLILESLFTSKI
jgi:hypothetical protein